MRKFMKTATAGRPVAQNRLIKPRVVPGAKPIVASNDRQRHIFENLKSKMSDLGDVIVSEGFLRFETKIVNGRNVFQFKLKKGNDDNITERRIDDNDGFLITHLGFFLMKRLETNPGIEVLQTYPNSEIFKDVAGEAEGDAPLFIGSHLEAIYNGALTVKVGQTVYIDGLDLHRFRAVPQTQGGDKAIAQVNSKDGFHEVTPQILINGSQSTEITVQAPVNGSMKIAHTAESTNNYVVLVARGFLVKNK